MSAWICSDCRRGEHHHDRYPDGSDAGCPRSPDTITECACRKVVHEGHDWRARALAAEAARDGYRQEVERLREEIARHWRAAEADERVKAEQAEALARVEALAARWAAADGEPATCCDLTAMNISNGHGHRLRAALEVTPDA